MKHFLLAMLMAFPVFAQSNWQIRQQNSSLSVVYKNKTIISHVSLAAFAPNYAGQTFNFNDAKLTQNGNVFTLTKNTASINATLTITCEPSQATFALAMKSQLEGPVEYGFYIPVKNFATDDGNIFCRLGKQPFPINMGGSFEQGGSSSVSFDLPEIHHEFTNLAHGYFTLQDKRNTDNGNVRWIAILTPDDQKMYTCKHVWSVKEDFDDATLALRKKTFRIPVVRMREESIDNAGFEKGLDGWSQAANVAIDTTVAHSGKQSARITVNNPKTENVYITRHIPIVGGATYSAECFVKTLDVEPVQGKMSSVGAGLIVEWADKENRWMAAGLYACNMYGTEDWKIAKCNDLRAPDGAGYACIFLALRDKGTAWFDDFKLIRTELSIDKVSPALGETLNRNTPVFSWLPLRSVVRYDVTLSQDETFPKDATRVYSVESAQSFQLRERLAPGRWYWKVDVPGSLDIQPWSFFQTAPLAQDCLPPTIVTMAKRVLDANTEVELVIEDDGNQTPVIKAHLQDKTPVNIVFKSHNAQDRTFTFAMLPQNGWKNRLNTVTVTASDSAGNSTVKDIWILNAPIPANPVIIDKNGHYSTNGTTIFPFGIYEVGKQDMLEVRRAGFDAVHTYRWESSQDDVGCRAYLDDCWAAEGLRAFIGFDRGTHTGKGIVQGNFEHIAHRVGALADHPALFCWYLFDEPEIAAQYVPAKLLTQLADLVRVLDPYHAVVMTTWGPTMNNYRRTWDTHWTQAYQKPAGVVAQIDEHRRFLKNDSPITLLVHCYDKEQTGKLKAKKKPDPQAFMPDYDWMRAAAFVGIVKDCNGLWWWWFARQQNSFFTAAQVPHAWAGLQKVVAEIKSMRPILTADAPTQSGTVKVDKAAIEWWSKTVNGTTTFIAINTSEDDVTAELDVPRQGKKAFAFNRFEVKVITIN